MSFYIARVEEITFAETIRLGCTIFVSLAILSSHMEEDVNFLDPQESQIAVVIAVGMVSVAFWLSYHQSWL